MLLSTHFAEVAVGPAVAALRERPDPSVIEGLRWAETWLMNPLRTGMMLSTEITGVALTAAWEDDESLDRFLAHPLARPYARGWRARFEVVRTVGAWPQLPDLPRQERPVTGPVAVFTLARLRLRRFPSFVATVAAAERDAVHHPALLEGTALIHPPNLLATFTVWRSVKEMRQYAVGSYPGGHLRAMRKHEERVFHDETVFVRLRPYEVVGQWKGRNPFTIAQPAPGPAGSGAGAPAVLAAAGDEDSLI